MPQPRLADGRLLGDAMTGRCALIAKPHCLAQSPDDKTVIMTVDASSHPEVDAILADRRLDAFILRPDFYCFGAAVSDDPGGVAGLLDEFRTQVTGR